ncbi:MAG: universal stress protein [Flavobacteriales bacterium]|nr:universal stress protein [Flavobacteriales bacterium]
MKKILVPTDFSENAAHAAQYALALFQYEAVHIMLFHAYNLPHGISDTLISIDDILKQNAEDALATEISRLTKINRNPRAMFSSKAVPGEPSDAIVRDATKDSFDLIVMGTRGAGGIRGWLMGSNTVAVIERAPCSVLAIPGNVSFTKPTEIVVAVDRIASLRTSNLGMLKHIGATYQSHITLMHVATEEEDDDNELRLKAGNSIFSPPIQVSAETIRNPNFISGLEEYLQTKGPTRWLVMIPHRRSSLDRLVRKSQTKLWARHTSIPLLALKELR